MFRLVLRVPVFRVLPLAPFTMHFVCPCCGATFRMSLALVRDPPLQQMAVNENGQPHMFALTGIGSASVLHGCNSSLVVAQGVRVEHLLFTSRVRQVRLRHSLRRPHRLARTRSLGSRRRRFHTSCGGGAAAAVLGGERVSFRCCVTAGRRFVPVLRVRVLTLCDLALEMAMWPRSSSSASPCTRVKVCTMFRTTFVCFETSRTSGAQAGGGERAGNLRNRQMQQSQMTQHSFLMFNTSIDVLC